MGPRIAPAGFAGGSGSRPLPSAGAARRVTASAGDAVGGLVVRDLEGGGEVVVPDVQRLWAEVGLAVEAHHPNPPGEVSVRNPPLEVVDAGGLVDEDGQALVHGLDARPPGPRLEPAQDQGEAVHVAVRQHVVDARHAAQQVYSIAGEHRRHPPGLGPRGELRSLRLGDDDPGREVAVVARVALGTLEADAVLLDVAPGEAPPEVLGELVETQLMRPPGP